MIIYVREKKYYKQRGLIMQTIYVISGIIISLFFLFQIFIFVDEFIEI
jgi:hypothetical protein